MRSNLLLPSLSRLRLQIWDVRRLNLRLYELLGCQCLKLLQEEPFWPLTGEHLFFGSDVVDALFFALVKEHLGSVWLDVFEVTVASAKVLNQRRLNYQS